MWKKVLKFTVPLALCLVLVINLIYRYPAVAVAGQQPPKSSSALPAISPARRLVSNNMVLLLYINCG